MKKLQTSLLVAVLALNVLSSCNSNVTNDSTPTASPTASNSGNPSNTPEQNPSINQLKSQLENTPNDVQKWKDIQQSYVNFTNHLNAVKNYTETKNIDNKINSQLNETIEFLQNLQNLKDGKTQEVKTPYNNENFKLTQRNSQEERSKKAISKYLGSVKENINKKFVELEKLQFVELAKLLDNGKPNNSNGGQDDTKNNSIGLSLLISSLILIILVGAIIYFLYFLIESQKKNNKRFQYLKKIFEDSTKKVTEPDTVQNLQEQLNLLQETTKTIDASINNFTSKANISAILSQINQQYQSQTPRTLDLSQIQSLIQEFRSSISQIIKSQDSQFNSINKIRQTMGDLDQWLKIPQQKLSSPQHEENQAISVNNNEAPESRIKDLESHIQTLQKQLEQASLEKQELESQLRDINEQRKQWQQYFDTEQQKLNYRLQQEIKNNANINNNFSNLQAENQTLKAKNQKLESQIKGLQKAPISEPKALPPDIARLVELYNDNPDSLGQHTQIIAEVVVDGQSFADYRKNIKQHISLKLPESGSSEYLIVSPHSGVGSKYFLFPKQNIVGTAESSIIQALFQCHEYRKDETSQFSLKRPAEVWRSSTNEQEWRFEKQNKGELQFST